MLKPRILVTGATGKTGSVVVAELLQGGYSVRAMVHREDGRSARLKAQGAEIAVADMSDVERVADALKDVQRAYYCPPFDPYMIQGAVAFAIAARESRLEHIVSLTQWLSSPSHPALMTRQLWLVDRLFSMTPGVAHTIVRPGFFADAYLALTGFAAHLGVFPWIYGDSRNAPPSNEDIARVAVAALMDPARHAGKSYRPTGPELLGAKDMAKAIGRAVGRSVRVVPMPTWLFMKAARMGGLPIDLNVADMAFLRQQYGAAILSKVNFERGRVRPSASFDASAGVSLYQVDRKSVRLQADVFNLFDRLNVINFAGVLSGTALQARRNFAVRLNASF